MYHSAGGATFKTCVGVLPLLLLLPLVCTVGQITPKLIQRLWVPSPGSPVLAASAA